MRFEEWKKTQDDRFLCARHVWEAAQKAALSDPVAWMTEYNGHKMLWLDKREALTYCDDDEEPVALYAAANHL